MSIANRINNRELTHEGVGFQSDALGQSNVKVGLFGRNSKDTSDQIPVSSLMKTLKDVSPYAFNVYGTITLPAPLASAHMYYPCVLYDFNRFGTVSDTIPKKRWRMYVQVEPSSDGTIYWTQSNDGVTWDTPVQLSTTPFPAAPARARQGIQVFYNPNGIVTVSGTSYNWATIYRKDDATTLDATDMILAYSTDGIVWTAEAMGNHDTGGDPFTEIASSGGMGAAYMAPTGYINSITYNAARPLSVWNAPGDWVTIMRYRDEPAGIGDAIYGTSIMGMNSSDAADYKEMGSFSQWKRSLLKTLGERSFGQYTKCVLHHVVRLDAGFFIGLVQYYKHVSPGTRVSNGIGLAISKDGLYFDHIGPLYAAGLVQSLNERTGAVDATNGASTAYLLQQGDGDGSAILAGSVVADSSGKCFGRDCGSLGSHMLRVYWTEEDADKILMGYI